MGGSKPIGLGGKNAINVRAPIVITGAVSPIALAIPIITPVKNSTIRILNNMME